MPVINYAAWDSEVPLPLAVDLEAEQDQVLVQIPPDLQRIKSYDLSIAQQWRDTTRLIFETYFQRGYVVTGFASSMQSRLPNLYRLERKTFPASFDFSAWADGVSKK
jgi:predicted GNAT superfamily acetyltransferase